LIKNSQPFAKKKKNVITSGGFYYDSQCIHCDIHFTKTTPLLSLTQAHQVTGVM